MGILGDIRQATQLWIVHEGETADIKQLTQQLHTCNSARDDLLSGNISFDDYLDVLNQNEVNLEAYEETVEENLGLIYG